MKVCVGMMALLFAMLCVAPGCSEDGPEDLFGENEATPVDPSTGLPIGQTTGGLKAVGPTPSPVKKVAPAEDALYFCVQDVGLVRLDDTGFRPVPGKKRLYCKAMFVGPVDGAAHVVGWSVDKVTAAGRTPVAQRELIGNAIHDFGALGPDGRKLVGKFRSLYVNDGKRWTSYDHTAIGFKEGSLKHGYIDAKGRVFAATTYGFFVLEKGKWTTVFDTAGSEQKVFINGFQVLADGRVLFDLSGKLGVYDGKTLVRHKTTGSSSRSIHLGDDGWVYVLSRYGLTGIDMTDFSIQKSFSLASSGLKAKQITHGTRDDQGRFWLTTDGGVLVLDKAFNPTFWPMGSVPAIAGSVGALVAVGRGPAQLPAVGPVATGHIRGQFFHGGSPAAGVPVELCDRPASVFKKTPCAKKTFFRRTTTDSKGAYIFREVPLNAYAVTAKIGGKWHKSLGTNCKQLEAGQTCDVGRLTVKAASKASKP